MSLEEYKGVFVFAQQVDNVLDGVAFELLGKGKDLAKDLNTEVTAVLIGSGVKGLADQLAEYGADRVIVVDDPELKAKMPCLVTALSELNQPRYMTPGGIFDACDKEVTVWGRADLKDVDDSDLGLKGSPTKIAKASDKVAKGAGEKVNLDPAESVAYLIGKFKEKHII